MMYIVVKVHTDTSTYIEERIAGSAWTSDLDTTAKSIII